MPQLRQLSCSIQWAATGAPFPEYGTVYGDGVVETFVVVPNKPQAFTIRLASKGFINEGVAAIIFLDGTYHTNRSRTNLVPYKKSGAEHLSTINFLFRQKEQSLGDGMYMGREWRFDDHNIVSETPNGIKESHFDELGTIEVIVLRCQARTPEQRSASPASSAADSDIFENRSTRSTEEDTVVEKQVPASAHNDTNSQMGGIFSLFDGASDDHVFGLDGTMPPNIPHSWQAGFPYAPQQPAPASQGQQHAQPVPEKHVHFDFGPFGPPPDIRTPHADPVGARPPSYDRQRVSSYDSTTTTSGQEQASAPSFTPPTYHWPYQHNFGLSSGPYQYMPYVPQTHYPMHLKTHPPMQNFQPPTHHDPSQFCAPCPVSGTYGMFVGGLPVNHSPNFHLGPGWTCAGLPNSTYGPVTDMMDQKVEDQSQQQTQGPEPNQNTNMDWDTGNPPAGTDNETINSQSHSNNKDGPLGGGSNLNGNDNTVWGNDANAAGDNNASKDDNWNSWDQNAQPDHNAGTTTAQNDSNVGWGDPQNANDNNENSFAQAQNTSWDDNTANGAGFVATNVTGNRPLYGPYGQYCVWKAPVPTDRAADAEEEPRYDVPLTVAQRLSTTKQVQPGKGYLYYKKRCAPDYIDTMTEPYARFVFKYRTKEQLKAVAGIEVDAEPTADEATNDLLNLDKTALVDMLMRAKVALGGTVPSPPKAVPATMAPPPDVGPVPVDPPQHDFLKYHIPRARAERDPVATNSTGSGVAYQEQIQTNTTWNNESNVHQTNAPEVNWGGSACNDPGCTVPTSGWSSSTNPTDTDFNDAAHQPNQDARQTMATGWSDDQQPSSNDLSANAKKNYTSQPDANAHRPAQESRYFPPPPQGDAYGHHSHSASSSPVMNHAATFDTTGAAHAGSTPSGPTGGW